MPDLPARLGAYLSLAATRPELFELQPGGIRILLDPREIQEVEGAVALGFKARGVAPAQAAVGIILEDPWFFVLRDAVEFPDGARRTHARFISRSGHGAAALPVLDGKIVLLRHARHATRRWLLEIPRGGVEHGQSSEDAARNELQEEIGALVRRMVPLGFVYGLTNLCAHGAHLFLAELDSVGAPQIGEGIVSLERYSVREFEEHLLRGEILDSFTVAAYAHAKLRRLI